MGSRGKVLLVLSLFLTILLCFYWSTWNYSSPRWVCFAQDTNWRVSAHMEFSCLFFLSILLSWEWEWLGGSVIQSRLTRHCCLGVSSRELSNMLISSAQPRLTASPIPGSQNSFSAHWRVWFSCSDCPHWPTQPQTMHILLSI